MPTVEVYITSAVINGSGVASVDATVTMCLHNEKSPPITRCPPGD
jgi:hypothetical protein